MKITLDTKFVSVVVPNLAGVNYFVFVALCSFSMTAFGYKCVHTYELWSWVPVFITILLILDAIAGPSELRDCGTYELGGLLSFGSIVFSFLWASHVADHSHYGSAEQCRWKAFVCTFIRLALPLLSTEMLGVVFMTVITADSSDCPAVRTMESTV